MQREQQISAPVEGIPIARSLFAAEALRGEIARAYPIDRPEECTLLRTFVNDVYLLTAPGARYILKIYRPAWRYASALLWEADLLAHLADRGAPVSPVIPRRDGRTITAFAAPEDIRYGMLFEYAEGKKPRPPFNAHLSRQFGKAAGLVHARSEDFVSTYQRQPLDLSVLVDEPLAALRPFLAHRPTDWDYTVHLTHKLRSGIETLADQGLDWGVCHHDMSLDNVHCAPDGRVTFFDFDSGGPGWRVLDFQGIYADSVYHDDNRWDAFLGGYSEIRKLGSADLAAIPYFVLAYALWSVHMAIVRSRWTGVSQLDDDFFDQQMGERGWWRKWEARHLRDD